MQYDDNLLEWYVQVYPVADGREGKKWLVWEWGGGGVASWGACIFVDRRGRRAWGGKKGTNREACRCPGVGGRCGEVCGGGGGGGQGMDGRVGGWLKGKSIYTGGWFSRTQVCITLAMRIFTVQHCLKSPIVAGCVVPPITKATAGCWNYSIIVT